MTESKKISIIIPIFNAEKYLRECLDSVIDQTYKNIEIICVNDGSTDCSLDICREYQSRDERIQIIDKENGGVSSARNAALEVMTGEFVAFLDSDDCFKTNTVEKAINAFDEDIDAVFFRIDTSTIDTGSLHAFTANEEILGNSEDAMLVTLEKYAYGTMICNKVFRTRVVKKNNSVVQFNTSLKCGEDEVWIFEVLHNCRKIKFLPDELYYWRVNTESAYREKTINDVNIDDLSAQVYLLKSNLCIGQKVKNFVMLTLNKKIFEYMVRAYTQKNIQYYKKICDFNKKYKKNIYLSDDVKLIAKIKRIIITGLMKLHFPGILIERLYELR